ncbi:MAG: NUDIX hydrolase [Gaiellaceae bacterium]
MTDEVRAAGGIVVRRRGDESQVLLVHRPHYSDWTFPKGKAKAGESDEACALREVEEEALLRCRIGPELGRTSYSDSRARPKTVVYFRMETDGEPLPGDRVDEVRWARVDDAIELLSWERDRDLLASAASRL